MIEGAADIDMHRLGNRYIFIFGRSGFAKLKQSQPLNLKTNVPSNQRVGADQRNRPAESNRFSLPNDP